MGRCAEIEKTSLISPRRRRGGRCHTWRGHSGAGACAPSGRWNDPHSPALCIVSRTYCHSVIRLESSEFPINGCAREDNTDTVLFDGRLHAASPERDEGKPQH